MVYCLMILQVDAAREARDSYAEVSKAMVMPPVSVGGAQNPAEGA